MPRPPALADIEPAGESVPDEVVEDDRHGIQPGDRALLIIEDDVNFARVLLDLARERGFKGIVAVRGLHALRLLKQFKPAAVTLDLRLPDMDGWILLDRIKHDPATSHIPVHVISVQEDPQHRGLAMGADAVLQKPVSKEALLQTLERIAALAGKGPRKLLVVEDDPRDRQQVVDLIGNGDIKITAVATGGEALQALEKGEFQCMVMDLGLPDMSGFQLLDRIKADPRLKGIPVVVWTGRELTRKEEVQLRRYAEAVILKDARSPERLLAETALFLHRVEGDLPEPKRKMIDRARQEDPVLAGKKVLVVDDDVRNIFSIAAVLERRKMRVFTAESGKEALDQLRKLKEMDVILLDIMRPEMDGYEAIREVRKMEGFKKVPILAVTAKAMKGDREKCMEAGANDYVTKPVDLDQLMSLLRVWLYR